MTYPDDYINKILHSDCLELMKQIPDRSVDLTITSPPYNLGNNHHTGKFKHQPYHDDMPEPMYEQQQIRVLSELYRITKDNGSLLYNHKNRIKKGKQLTPYKWLLETEWVIKQELVWFNGSQNFDKIRFYPMTERIYWLAKSEKTKLFNSINHHDLFNWSPEGTNKKHTRSFPLSMAKDLIQCFPTAKTILDPFCGSGTTCIAAKALGRRFIGIDTEQKYVDIANRRLHNTVTEMFC